MAIRSNGITPEVIREIMPPYQLSADLLQATFATLPAPPPDTSPAWREARSTWLIQEILACKPADAGQARIAAQLLIVRELADTFTAGIHAPGVTLQQMSGVQRTVTSLLRTAVSLDRSMRQHQQKPVPFFGVVVEEPVDLPALDAAWRRQRAQPDAPPNPPPRAPAGERRTPGAARHRHATRTAH